MWSTADEAKIERYDAVRIGGGGSATLAGVTAVEFPALGLPQVGPITDS